MLKPAIKPYIYLNIAYFLQVCRSKPRRLLLLNDQVVCAAVSGRVSEVTSPQQQGQDSVLGAGMERLNVKWAAGVEEVGLETTVTIVLFFSYINTDTRWSWWRAGAPWAPWPGSPWPGLCPPTRGPHWGGPSPRPRYTTSTGQ